MAQKSAGAAKKRTVVTETVGKIISDTGEIIWICPHCKMPDDGSPMIGCDECDDWYHWPCVGLKSEPSDEEWFCSGCKGKQASSAGAESAGGRKKKSGGATPVSAGKSKKVKKK